MAVTLQEILAPQFILDLISRIRPGQQALGNWLGFQPNRFSDGAVALSGPATASGPLRNFSYRVFNYSRVPMVARSPGVGPAVTPPNPLGTVSVTCMRFHEKLPLNYEFLGNISTMVGPNSVIDSNGQDYIKRQTNYIANKASSMIEMMAAGMMRDSLYYIQSGENWLPTFDSSGAAFQVNFQIPSGNKSQLNMLGAGDIIGTSWDNPAAPIVQNCLDIEAAYAQLNNLSMTDVWINSRLWKNIITNTEVRNTAGSSNQPFAEFARDPERGMDGLASNQYVATLRGLPTVRWHLYNNGLSLGGNLIDVSYAQSTATFTLLIPNNMAIFCSQASPDIAQLYQGGELVVENPGMPAVMRQGWYFWHEYVTQPSAIDLIGLLNAVPVLYIPTAFAPGTVVF